MQSATRVDGAPRHERTGDRQDPRAARPPTSQVPHRTRPPHTLLRCVQEPPARRATAPRHERHPPPRAQHRGGNHHARTQHAAAHSPKVLRSRDVTTCSAPNGCSGSTSPHKQSTTTERSTTRFALRINSASSARCLGGATLVSRPSSPTTPTPPSTRNNTNPKYSPNKKMGQDAERTTHPTQGSRRRSRKRSESPRE